MTAVRTVEQRTAGHEDLLGLHRTMVKIREFELMAARLITSGRIPGFLHTSVGQEACAVGVCAVLRPADYVSTTHRGHGHCIAKGGDLRLMMAELFGRKTGYAKGRAGSMHISDPACGILSANGIVGGGLPMSVGAAYSAQLRGTDGVSVAFFGDGAVAEGAFHEAMTLASVWNLPVIFVCENNLYAEMSHISVHMKSPDVFRRAEAYDIAGVCVDGNDVLAVWAAAAEAVGRARAGEGATLLECKTYRWRGHFEGDPQRYRKPEEVAEWMKRDPIIRFREELVRGGLATEIDLDRQREEVLADLESAVAFAEASAAPTELDLLTDVYAED